MIFKTFDIVLMYLFLLIGFQFIFLSFDLKITSGDKLLKHIGILLLSLSLAGFIFGIVQSYNVAVKEDNFKISKMFSEECIDSIGNQLDSLTENSEPETIFDIYKKSLTKDNSK